MSTYPTPLELAMYSALRGLTRGDCWCEMAIGNPMYHDHTASCIEARNAVRAFESRFQSTYESQVREVLSGADIPHGGVTVERLYAFVKEAVERKMRLSWIIIHPDAVPEQHRTEALIWLEHYAGLLPEPERGSAHKHIQSLKDAWK